MGLRARVSAPPWRLIARARSKRGRNPIAVSGRGSDALLRAPSVMENRVPGAMSDRGTALATIAATCPASPEPTPARCSMRGRLSFSPMVAVSWISGRSGAAARRATASVAAKCLPCVEPCEKVRSDCARNSTCDASSRATSGAASSGAKRGQNMMERRISPTRRPRPRNQVPLPTFSARSCASGRRSDHRSTLRQMRIQLLASG